MKSMSWMGVAVLVPAAFACAAQQQTADGEPTRPGGIEIGYAEKEGLGVVPKEEGDGNWPTAKDQLEHYLAKPENKGLAEGGFLGGRDYLVVKGAAFITRGQDEPYSDARLRAFLEARSQALSEIAAQLRATVGSRFISRDVPKEQWSEAERAMEMTFGDQSEIGEIVAYRELVSRIAIEVDQNLGGAQVFKVFEGPDDLAILMTWSENNTEKLRQALLKPDVRVKGKSAQSSITDWVRAQKDALLFTHGAQVRTDENGELCIVVFGQSDLRGRNPRLEPRAMDEAKALAAARLREFLGERVVAELRLGSTTLQADGNEGSRAGSQRTSDIAKGLVAESLEMSIPLPIYSGTFQHPNNLELGIKTAVVVLSTNVSQLQSLDQMRQQMSKVPDLVAMMPTPPAADSSSRSVAEPAGSEPTNKAKPKPRSSGGQGATGEAP